MVAKIEDGKYAVNAMSDPTDDALLLTIDFGQEKYEEFLAALPSDLEQSVKAALTRQPYKILFKRAIAPFMTIAAKCGDTVYTNEDESYCPFEAEKFISEYVRDDDPDSSISASDSR
jgi:hypothetical protein